jgi:alkylhydroperoxidase family enzyme
VAHIDVIGPEDADGLLQRVYRQRTASAGRLWNIVSIQCHNPEALRESMRLYAAVMFGDSPLTRAQREMIAVVTSQANDCHY